LTIIGNNAAIAEALDWQLSQLILNPQRRVAWRNLILTPNVGEIYLRPSFMSDASMGSTKFQCSDL
jgi:hypothetical protein